MDDKPEFKYVKDVSGDEPLLAMMFQGDAPGAIPSPSRITKVTFEEGDSNQIGAGGTVLSSIGPMTKEMIGDEPNLIEGEYGYFVEWDAYPGIPCFVRGNKIARA